MKTNTPLTTHEKGQAMKVVSIVFVPQPYDDTTEVTRLLDNLPAADGLNDHAGVTEAVEYLSQWDYGDESEHTPRDSASAGWSDYTASVGNYLLSWNFRLEYIGLDRIISE